MNDGVHLALRLSLAHVRHCSRFWEPVVLTVYDAQCDVTYWEVIQSHLESSGNLTANRASKTTAMPVPLDNLIDEQGLQRLKNITRRRFERHEAQREGAEILIEELRCKWGVEITFDPESGMLILPGGKFVCDGPGQVEVIAFGRLHALFQKATKMTGHSPSRIIEEGLDFEIQVIEALQDDRTVEAVDRDGNVYEWKSLEEFDRDTRQSRRHRELDWD